MKKKIFFFWGKTFGTENFTTKRRENFMQIFFIALKFLNFSAFLNNLKLIKSFKISKHLKNTKKMMKKESSKISYLSNYSS